MIYQRLTKTVTASTYTTTDADNGYRIIFNNATGVTVTLHTATGRYNFDCEFDNIGAGAVTVSGQTIAQYGHAHIGNNGGSTWTVAVSGGGSGGSVDSVNGETGTVVLDAADIDITDSGGHFTATDVEGALSELFTSVSNGKTDIAASITGKGGTASGDDTFAELADAIDALPSGSGTYQSKTVTPDAAGFTVSPDGGYDALSSVVINGDSDLAASNIKSGVVIFGVTGTYSVSEFTNLIRYKKNVIPTDASAPAASSISLTVPSDTNEGDVIVAYLAHRASLTPPSGFTLAKSQANIDSSQFTSIYYKVASSSDAGSSVTFTQSSSVRISMGLIILEKASGVSVEATNGSAQTATPLSAPSATTAVKGSLLIAVSSNLYAGSSDQYYFSGTRWTAMDSISTPTTKRLCAAVVHISKEAMPSVTLTSNVGTYNVANATAIFAPA